MSDVEQHKQIANGSVSVAKDSAYDSDLFSSTSFSVDSSTIGANAAASTRIDDSVLAETVKCNKWGAKNVKSVSDFGTFADISFNAFMKNGRLPFEQAKNNNKSGITGFDARWIVALIFFIVVIIAYKMVIVTVPYANKESFFEVASYAQDKYRDMLYWADENQLLTRLTPLICGIAVSIFSIMMVYFDSSIPGVDPPSPFSPRSKRSYRQQKQTSINLAYMTAIASGIVVTGLMYFQF